MSEKKLIPPADTVRKNNIFSVFTQTMLTVNEASPLEIADTSRGPCNAVLTPYKSIVTKYSIALNAINIYISFCVL